VAGSGTPSTDTRGEDPTVATVKILARLQTARKCPHLRPSIPGYPQDEFEGAAQRLAKRSGCAKAGRLLHRAIEGSGHVKACPIRPPRDTSGRTPARSPCPVGWRSTGAHTCSPRSRWSAPRSRSSRLSRRVSPTRCRQESSFSRSRGNRFKRAFGRAARGRPGA
jgi:hypothetical protein